MLISDPNADVEGPPHLIEIELAWEIGRHVWHRTSSDGQGGIVTGYIVREKSIAYLVTWGDNRQETGHFGYELTGASTF